MASRVSIGRLTPETISGVFRRALESGSVVAPDDTALVFYDLSAIASRVADLAAQFPPGTLHAVAIKANPLTRVLNFIASLGAGCEAATLPELRLAQSSGVTPDRIVFDSPVKTVDELKYALALGCHVNADSLYELDRIASLIESGEARPAGTIGVRINPQVGTGRIALTSVAGEYSKFGVPIREQRRALVERFVQHEWLTSVHVHIGSQGCPVDMLLDGVGVVLDFVGETNRALRESGRARAIEVFDLGGGLPVSYRPGVEPVSMAQYAARLRERFPELFDGRLRLITEFGRYVHANSGWVASRVEYVKRDAGINTAMIHVGADLLLRRCYSPHDWHHEIFVLDRAGALKQGRDANPYVVAGPLCFAGDVIARDLPLPPVEEGDYVVVQDAGAYTLGMWSRYNSRQIPKVVGYREDGADFTVLKERESVEGIIRFWS